MIARSVLVVEDEVLVGLDMVAILEAEGYETVRHAVTEAEALQQIETGQWDAVVADANLNGRSIQNVVLALQARQIPFVIVTGYERQHLPATLDEVPLFTKPFSTVQLVQTVRQLCRAE